MPHIPALVSREEIALTGRGEYTEARQKAIALMETLNEWLLTPTEHGDDFRMEDDGQGTIHLYFGSNDMDFTPYDLWEQADEFVRRLVRNAIGRGGWIGGRDEGGGHVVLRYR